MIILVPLIKWWSPTNIQPRGGIIMDQITFYGVRGSNPQSGADYSLGGHTLCTGYQTAQSTILFDAGTGITAFARGLIRQPTPTVHLCLSHYHLDHVMGLTLLEHLYTRDVHLIIHAPILEGRDPAEIFRNFIAPPLYPFDFSEIEQAITIKPFSVGETLSIDDCTLSTIMLHHPGSACGYRVRRDIYDFCYITDVGIQDDATTYPHELGQFVKGTPLLIQDAYFCDHDFKQFQFFGHGSYHHVAAFARDHDVGNLALYHHNPRYTDDDLKKMEGDARALHPRAFLSHEGMILTHEFLR